MTLDVLNEFKTSNKLKVLVLSSNTGFCYFYRLKWPLSDLSKKGLVDYIKLNPVTDLGLVREFIPYADIVISQFGQPQSLINEIIDLVNKYKLKKAIIIEFDDDYMSLHPTNLAYKYFGTKEIQLKDGRYIWKDGEEGLHNDGEVFDHKRNIELQKSILKVCSKADAITVSTDNLSKVYKKYNKNTFVLNNFINITQMPFKNIQNNKVVIGWQGGDSHYEDLYKVMPTLKKIKDKYGDKIEFKFMGACFKNLYNEVDGIYIPWVDPKNFFNTFCDNLFDIGLIPLTNNIFNRSKSNIKWLEYSYYMIPSVVSKVEPYSLDGMHEKNIMYYRNDNEMYNHIEKLILNKEFRNRLGYDSRQYVLKNYNITDKSIQWYNLYKTILSRK